MFDAEKNIVKLLMHESDQEIAQIEAEIQEWIIKTKRFEQISTGNQSVRGSTC